MLTIVQSWTAECDSSETPDGVYIEREANRTMHEKVDHNLSP